MQESSLKSDTEVKILVPNKYLCPINYQIMADPVILSSGNTYEREAILKWLEQNDTDPLENLILENKNVIPNKSIKSDISEFLEKNPDFINETYLPHNLIQELISALEKNEINLFSQILAKDRRLLVNDLKDKKNLLMLVCKIGSAEILNIVIKKLSEKILNLKYVKEDKELSLFMMVSRRLGLKGAEILLTAFEWKETDVQNLLNTAVKNNNMAIVKVALSLGAIPTLDLLNQTYLFRRTEILKVLVSAGAPINEKDIAGNDFLLRAIRESYEEFSLFLLAEVSDKIDPNTRNDAQETALHTAVEKNLDNIVNALLTHPKRNVDQVNGKQDTSLQVAVRNSNVKLAILLIQNKADVNIQTEETENPLKIAYVNKDIEMQKLLILSGAKIGGLLIQAIIDEEKDKKEQEISKGVSFTFEPRETSNFNFGLSPTMISSKIKSSSLSFKSTKTTRLSFNFEALPTLSPSKITSSSFSSQSPEIIKSSFIFNTPSEQRKTGVKKELIHFLLTDASHLVDINIDLGGKTPLMLAVNQAETVRLLLSHKNINIHKRDTLGNKVLHYAAEIGNQEVIKSLIKKGASIKGKNNEQKTPLQIAQENGAYETANFMEQEYRLNKLEPFLKPLQSKIESLVSDVEELKLKLAQSEARFFQMENVLQKSKEETAGLIMQLEKNQKLFYKPTIHAINTTNTANTTSTTTTMSVATINDQRNYSRFFDEPKIMNQNLMGNNTIEKQNELIKVLLRGNLEGVTKLEAQGASFMRQDKNGIYPLAAEVYLANLDTVRYIESKLKGEALKQWLELDIQKANVSIEKVMPKDLPSNATFGQWKS